MAGAVRQRRDGLALTSWLYSLLDVGAKFVFAFLLLRFLADEPESARSDAVADWARSPTTESLSSRAVGPER